MCLSALQGPSGPAITTTVHCNYMQIDSRDIETHADTKIKAPWTNPKPDGSGQRVARPAAAPSATGESETEIRVHCAARGAVYTVFSRRGLVRRVGRGPCKEWLPTSLTNLS